MCSADIDHQWKTQHYVYDGGAMDRWVDAHVNPAIVPSGYSGSDGPLTMAYFDRGDLEFYYALADNFTICDGYFCSVIGGTDINRLFTMTGTMDPDAWDGGVQFLDTQVANRQNYFGTLGASGGWKTYPELLQAAGISWKVYSDPTTNAEENPLAYFKSHGFPSGAGQPLYDNAFLPTFANFLTDCQLGTLPQVSWIFANFVTDSEHPPAPIEWGEDFVRMAVGAITASPQWSKSAMLITYDENGGFFDHVKPPTPGAHTPGEYIPRTPAPTLPAFAESGNGQYLDPIGLGFRVPMLVVSPFSRNPTPDGMPLVCSDTFDHTSTLRFLETVFKVPVPNRSPATGIPLQGTPGLSQWRRQAVGDLTSAFNFAGGPQTFSISGLPTTNRADPRVLGECITTDGAGHFITPQAPTTPVTPPSAPQTMPAQELAFGAVKRPSGPAGQAVCPAATIAAQPLVPPTPTTSTGAGEGVAAVTVAAGAVALLAGWWAARVRANSTAAATGAEDDTSGD
jgi:phospholipase C